MASFQIHCDNADRQTAQQVFYVLKYTKLDSTKIEQVKSGSQYFLLIF